MYLEFKAEEARVHRIQAFVHASGRFPLSSAGRINLAPLFAESAERLRHQNGRVGFVLPSGIATDAFTQSLFRYFTDGRIASLYDFENRESLFPAVDSRQKFCLLTLGVSAAAEFAFFTTRVEQLSDNRRVFRLTPQDFELLNPNTHTCPVFRSEHDAELAKKIYRRVGVFVRELEGGHEQNSWDVSFMLMFMMNTDSQLFVDRETTGVVPLYEGKMIHQFDHRWATYVIASVLPRAGVGNNLPLMLFGEREDAGAWAALLGCLNSLALDFVARHKVGGTHLNFFIYKQLPVLAPSAFSGVDLAFIVPRVLDLTYTAVDLTAWARELGYEGPPFAWDPARRALIRAELDAYYARLYGLTRDELRYVLDPLDLMGPGYPSETFRVLKQNEERQYGEYRTRRLVLEAWDRLFGD
jgi:hypothetical protein